MRAALLQMTSSDEPAENARHVVAAIEQAAEQGADLLLTPEVTNCLSTSRTHQQAVLRPEDQDETLALARNSAAKHGLWVLLGSVAVTSAPPEARFANRSILIDATGAIVARYDKIHMFDVQVTETETYRESAGYAPGQQAVVANTPFGKIGMTVCYDVRFPYLYRHLAQAGAQILTVPAAFSPATGPMHWDPLLRARAIENGAFVLAPAQTGTHPSQMGRPRTTYGHSLAISPWGQVLLDAGDAPGLHLVDLNLDDVQRSRQKVPSLQHDKEFTGPYG